MSRSVESESAELLARAREGSPEAWDTIVDRYGSLVLTVARGVGLSETDCEEVFQTTWTAFLGQIDLLQDARSLAGWLVVTAQRQAWRALRRAHGKASRSIESLLDRGPRPEDLVERWERSAMVREALAELTPRCRDLLSRLYLRPEGKSYVEVAEELGIARGTIGPIRARCLASLASALERRGMQ